MKSVKITNVYSSSSCNAFKNICDWSNNGIICFGANCSLAFVKPEESPQIISTTVGHVGKINFVKWISCPDREDFIITGSVDKSLILWKKENDEYIEFRKLIGHEGSVVEADAFFRNDQFLIVSSSIDLSIRIWTTNRYSDNCECIQILKFKENVITALALTCIDNNNALLICSTDDSRIHFCIKETDQFKEVLTILGHDDWIQSMDVIHNDLGSIFLATGSQDNFIKIWKINKVNENMDAKIKLTSNNFSIDHSSSVYTVSLESILHGHENWIYSVKWMRKISSNNKWTQPMGLLSASMDKTIIIWQQTEEDGTWVEKTRLGEVGGGNLGFYGAIFGPNNIGILAHGFHGSFHLWWPSHEVMIPGIVCSGHFNSVNDIAWNSKGEYLLSCSSDQTTRLHAVHLQQGQKANWHELARPQIHGYDLQCLAILNRFMFASGADEKIVRIFEAPRNFLQNFSRLCLINVENIELAPEGACVPALGLSNKAVYEQATNMNTNTEKLRDPYSDNYFIPQTLNAPPSEEDLLQNTLWPEMQKLYGHGYEVFAIASNPAGSILASACKASKYEHAFIILWSVSDWKIIDKLFFHSLTITQMNFSHNGNYLLSVSRDRTWCVFKHHENKFKQVFYCGKKVSKHARIIWSCAWSHDDKFFITTSRDKKAIVWENYDNLKTMVEPEEISCNSFKILELADSATAVDFAPLVIKDRYLLAIGLASGVIELFYFDPKASETWMHISTLSTSCAHHSTVKRLRFKPLGNCNGHAVDTLYQTNDDTDKQNEDNHVLQIASCSEDTFVKITQITIS